MKKRVLLIGAAVVLVSLLGLFGCAEGKRYNVDYGGSKVCFDNAQDSYPAGKQVTLRYSVIATDTDYYFKVEGVEADCDWENGAYVIRFVMPENDVKVTVDTRSSMIYDPFFDEYENREMNEGDLLVSYQHEVTGTPEPQGYAKWTLTYLDHYDALLTYLETSPESEEVTKEKVVPFSLVSQCLEVADKAGMDGWAQRTENMDALDGVYMVVSYLSPSKGEIVSVNSGFMPKDGMGPFADIRHIMESGFWEDAEAGGEVDDE